MADNKAQTKKQQIKEVALQGGHMAWMAIKSTCKLIFLLPILVGMVWFNFTVDRSGFFKGDLYEREVALALLDGQNVSGYDQMDERTILSLYVQNLPEALDTISLGSSRVLQLSRDIVGTPDYFNCGMSGADFRDLLGSYYLFERADKLPENMIIALDPWLLNGNEDAFHYRSDIELYNEFLSLGLGIDAEYEETDNTAAIEALFDPSYFQGNVDYLMRGGAGSAGAGVVEGDLYNQTTNVKLSDGTVLYTPDFRNATPEEVDAKAMQEAGTFVRMEGFTELDAEQCSLFDLFIQRAQGMGVNVVFLLVPYHPLVYTYASEYSNEYTGFFQTEQWFLDYAQENNIAVYGSYNPYVTGTLEEGFYDGLHITADALDDIFPGMRQVELDLQGRRPGSAYVYSEERVSYETAQELVMRRYEIEPPQVLVRGDDVQIGEELCYMLHRYETEAEGSTLLANYAVSKGNGTIYRYDTDYEEWIMYRQFT